MAKYIQFCLPLQSYLHKHLQILFSPQLSPPLIYFFRDSFLNIVITKHISFSDDTWIHLFYIAVIFLSAIGLLSVVYFKFPNMSRFDYIRDFLLLFKIIYIIASINNILIFIMVYLSKRTIYIYYKIFAQHIFFTYEVMCF